MKALINDLTGRGFTLIPECSSDMFILRHLCSSDKKKKRTDVINFYGSLIDDQNFNGEYYPFQLYVGRSMGVQTMWSTKHIDNERKRKL